MAVEELRPRGTQGVVASSACHGFFAPGFEYKMSRDGWLWTTQTPFEISRPEVFFLGNPGLATISIDEVFSIQAPWNPINITSYYTHPADFSGQVSMSELPSCSQMVLWCPTTPRWWWSLWTATRHKTWRTPREMATLLGKMMTKHDKTW